MSHGITGGIVLLCSFLLVNAPLKVMGRSFKFFILNWRKLRATSFWDGPLRIQVNWPDWPPSTGVNFQPQVNRKWCYWNSPTYWNSRQFPIITRLGNSSLVFLVRTSSRQHLGTTVTQQRLSSALQTFCVHTYLDM